MLTVKTYLAPSAVHGTGLYSREYIPARTVIWKFNRHIDKTYSHKAFLAICKNAEELTLQHLLSSSYRRSGKYFYLTDNARFINHSEDQNNIGFLDDFTEISLVDILPNQELLENYNQSYDATDYFFQEFTNPDPKDYLDLLAMESVGHA